MAGTATKLGNAPWHAWTVCALTFLAPVWQAHNARVIKLRPPTGELTEPFTSISTVRELPDGRVLVADDRDVRIVGADFRTRSVTLVGRRGSGPGEYRSARSLFATGGDSSLLVDLASGRWVILAGLRPVRTTPPDADLVRLHRGGVLGTDARGGVWRAELPGIPRTPGVRVVSDSGVVIRTQIATGEADTLVYLRLAPRWVAITQGGAAMTIGTGALRADEQAAPFPDGWFAVARLDPYRLEVYSSKGAMQSVFALPYARQVITEREKRAFLKRAGNPLAEPDALRGAPPAVRERMRRAFSDFPPEYPPFVRQGLMASPAGTVVLRKPETADQSYPRYDVIDRRTGYLGTLELPARERIVGFGAHSVYVAWADSDDIERLRRHAWPP